MYERGEAAFKRGDYKLAADYFNRAADKGQTSSLYGATGSAYSFSGNYEKADKFIDLTMEHLDSAPKEEREKRKANALATKGFLEVELGHKREAIRYYDEALLIYTKLYDKDRGKYAPSLVDTLNNLGWINHNIGQLKEAEVYYKEAIKIYRELIAQGEEAYYPNLASTLFNLGSLYNKTNRSDLAVQFWKEVLVICNKGEHTPDKSAKYCQMAEEALAEYEKLRAEEAARLEAQTAPKP